MRRLAAAATLGIVIAVGGGSVLGWGNGSPALPAMSVRQGLVTTAPFSAARPPFRLLRALRLSMRPSVPGRDGHQVWGASLALPWVPTAPRPNLLARMHMSYRPTPELELGLHSLGKIMGGGVQYVSAGGVRLGIGIYFNKIAPGTQPARQVMLSLQFPLPW